MWVYSPTFIIILPELTEANFTAASVSLKKRSFCLLAFSWSEACQFASGWDKARPLDLPAKLIFTHARGGVMILCSGNRFRMSRPCHASSLACFKLGGVITMQS
jgi:hypothetical protein